MEKNVENQAFLSPCSLKSSLLCKATLVLPLTFTCFLVPWSTPYLVTVSILLLSTIFCLTLSKRRIAAKSAPSQGGNSTSNTQSLHEEGHVEASSTKMEEVTGHHDSSCQGEVSLEEVCEVEATGFPSDSETTEESSGNELFELGWSFPTNVAQNIAISESGSSVFKGEDDDLIEINLPESEPDGCNKGSKLKLQPHLLGSIYRQDSQTEILEDDINEVNEDDSLIEIDLSMGSIKCSSGS